MSDLTTLLSTAFGIIKRLRDINENIKNAEFSNVIADLSVELTELKMKLTGVIEENLRLKEQVRTLQNVEGDPCPKCRRRSWELVDSKPDPVFGELGAIRRTYKCSLCGFSEAKFFDR